MSPGSFWHTKHFVTFSPLSCRPTFLQYPALKLTYYVQWALYCVQQYDICVFAGWLHEVQWVLYTAFLSMDMTGVYACLCETVCDVTTVPSHLKRLTRCVSFVPLSEFHGTRFYPVQSCSWFLLKVLDCFLDFVDLFLWFYSQSCIICEVRNFESLVFAGQYTFGFFFFVVFSHSSSQYFCTQDIQ